jgi:hypothetical protein
MPCFTRGACSLQLTSASFAGAEAQLTVTQQGGALEAMQLLAGSLSPEAVRQRISTLQPHVMEAATLGDGAVTICDRCASASRPSWELMPPAWALSSPSRSFRRCRRPRCRPRRPRRHPRLHPHRRRPCRRHPHFRHRRCLQHLRRRHRPCRPRPLLHYPRRHRHILHVLPS